MFGYDRYANRWIALGGGNQSLSFSPNTNRITTSGYGYDEAVGNLTNDGTHAYTFDAENKISKVDNVSAYVYDGEGQRVRKLVGEDLRFIYDMGGKQTAEFDGGDGTLKKEYVYGVSGLVATIEPTAVNANGTRYSTSDNLGSPRVVTNSGAGVVSRHDYRPFGEELGAGIGDRTTAMGFSVADGVRQQFTSKERDHETGLDYFGARYYSSFQGRFTSTDPSRKSVALSDPQTWNRYSYASNNPMSYIDRNGKWPTWIHNLIVDRSLPGLSPAQRKQIKDGSYSVDAVSTGGQTSSHSNEHGMTIPGQSQDEAAEHGDQFINTNVDHAQYANEHTGLTSSLYDFGRAFHTVSDMTSPAHEGYEVWYLQDAGTHRKRESSIDNYRMGLAVGATLKLYAYTYGQAALQRATGYTPGSANDPSVQAIQAQNSLPGSNPNGNAEALRDYRLGLQRGLDFDWSRQDGRRGRAQ